MWQSILVDFLLLNQFYSPGPIQIGDPSMALLVQCLRILFVYSRLSESESHSVLSDSLQPHGLYSPWNSPGQNTGAFPFSRASSQPRDQAQVSHIAGGVFTS